MAEPAIPADSFTSGVDMEERRLFWTIKHFPVVLQHDSMTTSQEMTFYAGDSIGLASKWSVFLTSKEIDGRNWAGIFIRIKERPALKSEFLFVQCEFKIKHRGGVTFRKLDTKLQDIYKKEKGLGFFEFADRNGEVVSVEETAVIHIKLKIYSPSIIPPSVKDSWKEFTAKSVVAARQSYEAIRSQQNKSLTQVKIVSNEKKMVVAHKEVISARSPVFQAMFESPMLETATGIIEIPDIGYYALKVLVSYLHSGEIKPEWMSLGILVELTNAAAKYQLTDLLQFLDKMVGKMCGLQDAGVLLLLANKLSLKTAEEELLRFVRMKGTSSAENFLQILRGHSEASSSQSRQSDCSCSKKRRMENEDENRDESGDNGPRK